MMRGFSFKTWPRVQAKGGWGVCRSSVGARWERVARDRVVVPYRVSEFSLGLYKTKMVLVLY